MFDPSGAVTTPYIGIAHWNGAIYESMTMEKTGALST